MKDRTPILLLLLLWVIAYSLAAGLDSSFQQWLGTAKRSKNLLATILGEGSRLFANYFFVKADVYFHSGYYPGIFDRRELFHRGHGDEEHEGEKHEQAGQQPRGEPNFLGKPLDVIDRFSRNFYPSEHTHLGEKSVHRDQEGDEVKEILPWLRIAAEMDPNKDETYTLAAYWLRTKLGRVQDAERFLREGWLANRDSYSIVLELARIYEEQKHDPERARNLYEVALNNWTKTQANSSDPDLLAFRQIVTRLAIIEGTAGHYQKAIGYWEKLRPFGNEKIVDDWINSLKARAAGNPSPQKQ
jgi:tetratricopeptide (TPR) repeat protein